MSVGSHLRELRKRLTIAAAGVVVGGIAGFILADPIFQLLGAPIAHTGMAEGRVTGLNFTAVTQAFDLKLQIAVTVGIVIASPVWLYEVWAFLVPGLVRRERQYALAFLATAIPLFLAGCAAGWLVLPHIVELMLGFTTANSAALLDARAYYDFVLKLLVATGVAFVVPVFLVVLNFAGVVSAAGILKGWRTAILLITVFAAFATPAADVLSMFLLALPMVALYFAAIGVAFLHDRRRARALALDAMPAGA
ncbi:twin-arginine translocase subunit TatC [Microbacterium ulmi]|uniref:Sec-independent protein translocase protein TatC n=1 Tax=Microbacterium ulmi TaxID=179095 RepID=A0A7Y2LY65_9MICO|nr:twin-arginine translocase subunit TatC [Microbacterium ulmi]NII68478.1 sec-independent protein translocase protein TatC [Microbacterium ulmi]NNH03000.1 twin-arginine translocase subunit TatC [Microbacterium ulmi]